MKVLKNIKKYVIFIYHRIGVLYMNKKILINFFVIIVTVILLVSNKVFAEEIENPYVDITFDKVAKENKNHATLEIFGKDEAGYYNNKSISYDVDTNGTYMAWESTYPAGGGFNLNMDKAIGGNYTIALKFSFSDTGENYGGWKKIIDFQSTIQPDSGFYFYNGGQIQFYPEDSQGPYIKNNQVVDLLIRRNSETNKFDVYNRVGDKSELCYTFIDEEGLSILTSSLGFFHDDPATNGEASPSGKVYSVKIWDSYMDVDDVWEVLDKEKEDAVSRYICKLIEGEDATEFFAGWKSYYECQDPVDNSYKYFEDEESSIEITDVEKWKEDEGYVSQTKSIEEIITYLNNEIKDINEDNVKSSDLETVENVANIIEKMSKKDATEDEIKELNQINDQCELLLKKINDTTSSLEEIRNEINKYTENNVTLDDKESIEKIISKIEEMSDVNLTEDEIKELNQVKNQCELLLEKIDDTVNSLEEIKNEINKYSEDNVTLNDKENIEKLISKIENINTGNLTEEEKEELNQIKEKAETLAERIDDISNYLKEVKSAVEKYSNKKVTSKNKKNIKKLISKYKDINIDNLTGEEKEQLDKNINILKTILENDLENPKTSDNIYLYVLSSILSLAGMILIKRLK